MAGEGLELAARALPCPLEGARDDKRAREGTPALGISDNLPLLQEDF